MQQTCILTNKPFVISEKEQSYCEKEGIPLPTIHPLERIRNMASFRNRSHLYNSECAYSKKKILSDQDPRNGFIVYETEVWESDVWDALDYERDYDFDKPFFEQFFALYKKVPQESLSSITSTMVNSDYTNGVSDVKNCYLVFSSGYVENSMFSRVVQKSNNIIDSISIFSSENIFECKNILNSYNLKYSENCFSCTDSSFLSNTSNCKNCFFCVNLQNKEYCFRNEQLTKEKYEEEIGKIDFGSYSKIIELKVSFQEFVKNFPIKNYLGKSNENSLGNYINNNNNCKKCFFVNDSSDLEYCAFVNKGKDGILHYGLGYDSELIYNTMVTGFNSYNIKFCLDCYSDVRDLEYCSRCINGTTNCFGCVGLKRKSYCVLNKQYSEEEYFELVSKIKAQMKRNGEYGQFFPASFSPYYYNESDAMDILPITKDEALCKGYKWNDVISDNFSQTYLIPDNIKDVNVDILNQFFACEKAGKKFKIVASELAFYLKNNIPIPRISPMARIEIYSDILKIGEFHKVNCNKCGKEIDTLYNQDERIIYCEECYQREVY